MRSTFYGFNIAKSGLFASQRALDVTGHNIANVNTPGYTRQRLNIAASSPMGVPGGMGMLGTGVDMKSVTQVRSQYLDTKLRTESTALGYWAERQANLSEIEAIFNEPSETGIRKVMDNFFGGFHELSKNPENLTVRALVRQNGIALSKTINHIYGQLEKMQSDMDFNISIKVGEINNYAKQITQLNKQIFNNELGGNHANDLRDARNLLVDKLSNIINIQTMEDSQGRFSIYVNGTPLVNHYSHNLLIKEDTITDSSGNIQFGKIKWQNSGSDLSLSGGELKALLDMRDNGDPEGERFLKTSQIDKFSRDIYEAMNAQNVSDLEKARSIDTLVDELKKVLGSDVSLHKPNNSNNPSEWVVKMGNVVLASSSESKPFNEIIKEVDQFIKEDADQYIEQLQQAIDDEDDDMIQDIVEKMKKFLGDSITLFQSEEEGIKQWEVKYKDIVLASTDLESNPTIGAAGVSTQSILGNQADQLVNGNNSSDSNYKGIQYYINKLDNFAWVLATKINEVHGKGTDLDGNQGLDFFAGFTSAKTIRINDKFEGELGLRKLAAAIVPHGENAAAYIPGDGSNALELSRLRHNMSLFPSWGSPDDYIKSLISNLGVDTQQAMRMAQNQQGLVLEIDNRRQSISGVSLDEEMASMIKFQHSYNASARMITTIDEMLDTIINRVGLVGR